MLRAHVYKDVSLASQDGAYWDRHEMPAESGECLVRALPPKLMPPVQRL